MLSGPVALLMSMLCVLMKILRHVSAKKKTKRLKNSKFRTFLGSFSINIMAVKGLTSFGLHTQGHGYESSTDQEDVTQRPPRGSWRDVNRR